MRTWHLPAIHGIISAVLLFIHRAITWNANVLFEGPLSILFVECLVTTAVCNCRLRSSQFSIFRALKKGFINTIKENSLSISMALLFSTMLMCNVLCLYYVDLPLYFVSRSLIVPIGLVLSYKQYALTRCVGVASGTVLVIVGYIGTLIEENLTNLLVTEGIIFGVLSSLCTLLYYQKAGHLAAGSSHEVQLNQVYLNNVVCCSLTFVAVLATEASEIFYLPFEPYYETFVFWLLIVVACLGSSFLGEVVLREVSSHPVDRRELFGVIRSVLQTVLAVLIFGTYTTVFWWIGVGLTAVGTVIYWKSSAHNTELPTTATTNATKDHLPLTTTNLAE